MNRDEFVVFEYLKNLYGENVFFEPEQNKTPDFAVNSSIAVEVRRLNQHYFEKNKSEGLESLSYPLFDAFEETLTSFDDLHTENSYWVFIEYKRPIKSNIHQIKRDMKSALTKFFERQKQNLPIEISVNEEVTFLFYQSNLNNGKLFLAGGSTDINAGGGVVSLYIDNIRHCIDEKSLKVEKHLQKYNKWWLYLVDNMGFWLEEAEILEVSKKVGSIGNFDKVVVLGYDGLSILFTMQKDKTE